jgi:superfamily II DNA or RNA helicase
MHDLRMYQQGAIQMIEGAWRRGKRAPVLVMPTGSGKTTVLAHLLRKRRERPVLFLCPWRQLVFQGAERFEQHHLPTGILMGSRKPQEGQTVHVASIQTAARRKLGDYSLVVVDECHRAVSRSCLALLDKYPNAKLLGLTATPVRLDGKPLSRAFDELLEPVSVQRLIEMKHLVPPRVYAPPEKLDLSKVRYSRIKRDYASGSAGKAMSKPKLLGDAIAHWRKHANGRATFIYCCNVDHADHVCETFNRAGIVTEQIDGSTSKTARAEIFERLALGTTCCVTNIGVLTEGVDFPKLRCQILLRPTLSMGLHLQIIGRGLRPSAGKGDCIVLDHADNFRRHGFPQDERRWSLKGRKKQTKPRKGQPPKAKQCPKCKAMVPPSTYHCPHCDHVWLPGVLPGTLSPLSPDSVRREQKIRW